MTINSYTKLYGLFGYPVKHSLSPVMHNAAFRKLGLNCTYLAFEVSPSELKAAVQAMRALGICGINVTIPHKEKILPLLDELSQEAELLGAVNTVVVKDRKLVGDNTDGIGFLTSLKKDAHTTARDKNVFILGAGGAARAVAFSLAKEGARSITFYDLISSRAQSLAAKIKRHFPHCLAKAKLRTPDSRNLRTMDILINATPVGIKEDDPLLIDPEHLNPPLLVFDLIYNPLQTKLLSCAKARGLKAISGLGMLLYQGAASFELWIKKSPPKEVMRKALQRQISGLGRH